MPTREEPPRLGLGQERALLASSVSVGGQYRIGRKVSVVFSEENWGTCSKSL